MPDFKAIVRQHLPLPEMKRRREEKIIEELAGQLRDLYQDARAGGMSERSALSHALGHVPDWETFASDIARAERPNLRLMNPNTAEQIEMSFRCRGGLWVYLADLGQDMRYALRALRSRPTFLLAVIFALALGIGASTAIFTVVETVLLRPLPFADPDRLIFLVESKLPQFPEFTVSPGNFLAWQAQNGTFQSMAAYSNRAFDLTGAGEPERFRGGRVTANLFNLLGVRPDIGLDMPAVAFALSMLTPLLFGLLPSIQVSRAELHETLNVGGRGGLSGVRRGPRRALITAEIALAAILLVGSGLLARSSIHLQQVDPGFIPSQAVVVSLALPDRRYPDEADAYGFYRRLIERVAHLPGVRAAGATAGMPFSNDYVTSVTIEGRPPVAPTERPPTNYYSASPGYFEAMGIRLLRGRFFTERDGPGTPRVGIINETFAKRLFPGEDPIGRRVTVSMGHEEWQQVVGIVSDTRQYGLTQDAGSQFYEPYGQLSFSMMTLVVRTQGDPASVTPALRKAVRDLDPDLPIGQVRTLEDLLSQSTSSERFSAILLGTFAASALLLAVIGVYGVLAYAVSQRSLELGVRVAHGARPGDVLWMFVREALSLALAGAALGLAGALVLTRLITSMLYGVEPTDPATLTLAPLVLVAAAGLASLIPPIGPCTSIRLRHSEVNPADGCPRRCQPTPENQRATATAAVHRSMPS